MSDINRTDFKRYEDIKSDCGVVTAADAKYAPYMFNLLASLHVNFPDHPTVYVYDLGMNKLQRKELSGVSWINLKTVPKFVEHWKLNWTWKTYVLSRPEPRYALYFDSASIVVLKSLKEWFEILATESYLILQISQSLNEIVPSNYWDLVGVDEVAYSRLPSFGAGIVGLDKRSQAGEAAVEAFGLAKEGWTLGCSPSEQNRIYDRSVMRDCVCFRADQTLLNLTFRKRFGAQLKVFDPKPFHGVTGRRDYPNQAVWYARRHPRSLLNFTNPLHRYSIEFFVNRFVPFPRMLLTPVKGSILRLTSKYRT